MEKGAVKAEKSGKGAQLRQKHPVPIYPSQS